MPPPKKKKGLRRIKRECKIRRQLARQQETPEERERRLHQNRLRRASYKAVQSEDMCEQGLAENPRRAAENARKAVQNAKRAAINRQISRERETPEARARRLQKNRLRVALSRALESDEVREKRLAGNARRVAAKRLRERLQREIEEIAGTRENLRSMRRSFTPADVGGVMRCMIPEQGNWSFASCSYSRRAGQSIPIPSWSIVKHEPVEESTEEFASAYLGPISTTVNLNDILSANASEFILPNDLPDTGETSPGIGVNMEAPVEANLLKLDIVKQEPFDETIEGSFFTNSTNISASNDINGITSLVNTVEVIVPDIC